MRVLLLGFLLVGCRVEPEDTGDTDPVGETGDTAVVTDDVDGDGYLATEDDCDDTNAAIHPGAAEVCNGVDDNCDANVDVAATDAPTWYDDDDGDGYGVEGIRACEQPEGAVAQGGDCHDGDATIHPGAEELCTDPEDRDCDGALSYADVDGDGVAACEDCDDEDLSAFPGALEFCDGVDQDCDGTVDEDAADATTWYEDADGDGYGGDASILACDGTGYAAEDGDCDEAQAAVNPGAVEVCGDGRDDDCDGADAECPG